jgi:predicted transcriptional regulator
MEKKKASKICPRCHGAGYLHDYEDLGSRMRGLREKAGLPRNAVSTRMGVSEGYLSDMERGDRPWSPDLMTKFIDTIS